ncbi:MAG: VWA domain-containing protein [Rhizobiaceae bacterium]
MTNIFKQFFGNASGNFGLTFAICAIPLFGLAGAALDYSQAMKVKSELQVAADSAAIAAIAEFRNGGAGDLVELASDYFQSNYSGPIVPDVRYELSDDRTRIRVAALADVPTNFLRLVGHDAIGLNIEAEASVGVVDLQIALVLDTTGSMNSRNKLPILKDTAEEFVESILPIGSNTAGLVEFALVPFNSLVRLDKALVDSWWLDLNGVSRAAWEGCVWDRASALDSTTQEPRRNDTDTHYQASPWDLVETGRCRKLSQILPLTDHRQTIVGKIRAMRATGRTNTNIGMVWGMNVLDSNLPFSGAREGSRKFIVMVSDGDNTNGRVIAEGGTVRDMDSATLETCSAAKGRGVEVFTVRVVNGNARMLGDCASSAGHYYNVTAPNQLGGVFDSISEKIWNQAVALRK